MLRLLLFSTKGSGSHYFGPGMSAYRMYKNIDKDNVTLSLAHGHTEQASLNLFDEQYCIGNLKSGGVTDLLLFLFKINKWVQKNAHKFDVVHCLGAFHASFMVAHSFQKAGVPSFIKITESKHTGFTESSFFSELIGFRRYRTKHANDVQGYIAISSEIENKLSAAGVRKDKIIPIPNGVNTDRFKPADKTERARLCNELGINNCFSILFTGAFSERKNPFVITKAFEKLDKSLKTQLILVGPDSDGGEQRNKIMNYIQSRSMENVILREHVADIEKYYQISDLFVLPSNEEGLSNSMLEAMASGLPVCVTKVSGAEDIIKEYKNGTFINRSPDSISEAFQSYINDSELHKKHSAGAFTTIKEGYDSKVILQKHLDLFRNAKNLTLSESKTHV